MTTTATPLGGGMERRIRALFAKAEATDYPEEAEAFLAKAQELMRRYAIDSAMVRTRARADQVTSRKVHVPAPYAAARSQLLVAVAGHNGCRVLSSRASSHGQQCEVFGFEQDLDLVIALYEHVASQAARALLRAPTDGERPRSFRQAFLLAYAYRIADRLAEASEAAHATASSSERRTAEIVIADRGRIVDAAISERYPRLGTRRVTASSPTGLSRGWAAAEGAALGHPPIAGRRTLPRGGR
jgi:hypothetical protein